MKVKRLKGKLNVIETLLKNESELRQDEINLSVQQELADSLSTAVNDISASLLAWQSKQGDLNPQKEQLLQSEQRRKPRDPLYVEVSRTGTATGDRPRIKDLPRHNPPISSPEVPGTSKRPKIAKHQTKLRAREFAISNTPEATRAGDSVISISPGEPGWSIPRAKVRPCESVHGDE